MTVCSRASAGARRSTPPSYDEVLFVTEGSYTVRTEDGELPTPAGHFAPRAPRCRCRPPRRGDARKDAAAGGISRLEPLAAGGGDGLATDHH
jgi:hypothetical protein